jgi:anaerobic dimethyl sulfoxide reductase subunit A
MYVPTWEMPSDPLVETYPLQMIGHHYKQRTHSTYGNVAWLKEAAPQNVWINALDAETRGIKQGDMIRVFNDRGELVLPAKFTTRIMPGVISVPQGAWYAPNAAGVDEGGSTNTLTSWRPSPLAKGNPQHTNLVQVEKA